MPSGAFVARRNGQAFVTGNSGFPKGKNKLKPAVEDWWLIRAPGPAAALHIDACRVGLNGEQPPNGSGKLTKWREMEGRSDVPPVLYNTGTPAAGRWPPHLLLQHSSGCVPTGVKRVRGSNKSFSTDYPAPNGYEGGWSKRLPRQDYADADGRETVADWLCQDGRTTTYPSYAYRNAVLTPLSSPAFLLDRLQALIQDLREYSKDDNSLLRRAAESYHNGRTLSAGSSDGLGYAVVRALGVTGFRGFQFDCRPCRHSCDELLRRVLVAAQDGLPSLLGVLDLVHSELSQHERSPSSQAPFRLSSSDDAHRPDTLLNTPTNRTSGDGLPPALWGETSSRTEGTPFQVSPLSAPRDDTLLSRIDEGSTDGISDHSECTADLVRLLCLLSTDLAYQSLLPALIIQRRDIVVNEAKCPVRELGEMSGETGNGYRANPSTPNQERNAMGRFEQGHTYGERGHDDTGTASRFYPNLDPPEWECEPGCPIAALDGQSGQSSDTAHDRHNGAFQSVAKGNELPHTTYGHADSGGASRFYPNIDPPFYYAAKASRRERGSGCDGLYWRADDTRGSGYRPITQAEYEEAHAWNVAHEDDRDAQLRIARGNMHPTVKNIKLLSWLINLLTVPGDVILDPFAGSGSIGVAALNGGRSFVGVEMDEDYIKICEARLAEAAATPRQLEIAV